MRTVLEQYIDRGFFLLLAILQNPDLYYQHLPFPPSKFNSDDDYVSTSYNYKATTVLQNVRL
jgi:hypothetical protein